MHQDWAVGMMVAAVVTVSCVLIGWLFWLVSRRKKDRLEAQVELQRRMLEKFDSAPDLTAFMASAGGSEFLKSFSTESGAHTTKLLASIRGGTVLTMLGLGFWIITVSGAADLGVAGTIVMAVGLGLLGSAGVSYRLARAWGLLPPSAR